MSSSFRALHTVTNQIFTNYCKIWGGISSILSWSVFYSVSNWNQATYAEQKGLFMSSIWVLLFPRVSLITKHYRNSASGLGQEMNKICLYTWVSMFLCCMEWKPYWSKECHQYSIFPNIYMVFCTVTCLHTSYTMVGNAAPVQGVLQSHGHFPVSLHSTLPCLTLQS